MTPQELHADYLRVCEMNIPINKKARVLTEVLSCYEWAWKVVGITKDALAVFKEHDFRKVSRMGINRSHIVDRHKTYTQMIKQPIKDCDAWWQFYLESDKTILSTSSENMTGRQSEVLYFNNNLFQSKGFAWRHNKEETQFLKGLFEEHLAN